MEAPDKDWQYLLFAAEPYETIGFKIPNLEIDKEAGKFYSNWDEENKVFVLQLFAATANTLCATGGRPAENACITYTQVRLSLAFCSALFAGCR